MNQLSPKCFTGYPATSTMMPTQMFIDLFNKIKDDQNAHKIVSQLHLMQSD